MVSGELSYREMSQQDIPFFQELINEKSKWKEIELKGGNLEYYLNSYHYLNGEWRVWTLGRDSIGVSFHINSAPSNGKPWLGTLILSLQFQKQGYGKAIIEKIISGLKDDHRNVMFAGVPFKQYNWIDFLAKCSFEQFKLEKDEVGNSYIIMIRPIE